MKILITNIDVLHLSEENKLENAFIAFDNGELIEYGNMIEWGGITDWRGLEIIDGEGFFYKTSLNLKIGSTYQEIEFSDSFEFLNSKKLDLIPI